MTARPNSHRSKKWRDARLAEGWSHWQKWVRPEVTAAMAVLLAQRPPSTQAEQVLEDLVLFEAEKYRSKTGNPPPSPESDDAGP